MRALVVNALSRGFDFEDVQIAAPIGREVLVNVQASGLCHTEGPDHVFDFVGQKSVGEQGLAMLGVGGGLYLVGVDKPEVNLDLNIFDSIGGQKRVQGVTFGSTNAKRDIPMYAELYLQGRMNLDDLVSKKISLRDVNDGYAALKDGLLNRVVVTSF
jgi:S-(hydroxymethyl)glutathione dehydrogenase/alcohol dehydrogenase